MTPREELLAIQKTISANLREDIEAYLGRQGSEFRHYLRRYEREFRSYRSITTKSALLERIVSIDILFIGDYHTLNQSQKTVIKILRELVGKRKSITLAMEMVFREHQLFLDQFMAGSMTEAEFLLKIDYQNNWGFPWANYKAIFDFAKINGIRVLGINCSARHDSEILSKRDECAAAIISEETLRSPESLLVVLYGDLHVAEKHLPRCTMKNLAASGSKRKYMIIFQNSDELYWKLAQDGKELTADVVKLAPKKFCIMNTPPWIKYQTYLNWIEKGGELLLSPKGEWSDEESESVDYFHQVFDLLATISSFLGLEESGLDKFHLYTTEEIEFVDFMNDYMKKRENISLKEVELIRAEVLFDGTCLIPEENVIYLSNLTINKVSEKAAQLLAYNMTKYFPRLGREGDRGFFYSRCIIETIGYIGSKIINFKRKADRIKDYKKLLADAKGKKLKGRLKDQKQIARLVLEHRRFELKSLKRKKLIKPSREKNLFHESPRIFLGVTKALGFILGEKLYNAMMAQHIKKDYIKALFSYRTVREGDSFQKYMELTSLVRDLREKYQSKAERF